MKNIILIISDQHNYKALKCYGHPFIETPNLDTLATESLVFDNFYSNSPLCVPSRLSFSKSQYVSSIGAWDNHIDIEPDRPSVAWALHKNYDCLLAGKMHYSKERKFGFTELEPNPINNCHRKTSGFPHRVQQRNCYVKLKGVMLNPFGHLINPQESSNPFRHFKHDRWVTEITCEYLGNHKGEKPFFLIVGYKEPHPPYAVPEKHYWEQYMDKVELPNVSLDYLERQPINYRCLRNLKRFNNISPELLKKAIATYYGQITWLDNQIGKVLKTIRGNPNLKDSIIIYTTDHGEHMGEKGLWMKNTLLEPSIHIPLIINYGGLHGRRKQICSLIDLSNTIAHFGGSRIRKAQGRSLIDVIENPKSSWDNYTISEHYGGEVKSGSVMLRRDDFKYIYHTWARERELYNLKQDPKEMNFISDKRKIMEMHTELVDRLGCDPDEVEQRIGRHRSPYRQRYR